MSLAEFARRYLTKWGNAPVVISNGTVGGERLQIMTQAARYQLITFQRPGEARWKVQCSANLREGGRPVAIFIGDLDDDLAEVGLAVMAYEFAVGNMKQSEAVGGDLTKSIKEELAKGVEA